MSGYYVYMLRCSDGSLYTGYTADLESRIALHRAGRGSKYVASRLPAVLAYVEEVASRRGALRREYQVKRLGRKEKLQLCDAQKEKSRRSFR